MTSHKNQTFKSCFFFSLKLSNKPWMRKRSGPPVSKWTQNFQILEIWFFFSLPLPCFHDHEHWFFNLENRSRGFLACHTFGSESGSDHESFASVAQVSPVHDFASWTFFLRCWWIMKAPEMHDATTLQIKWKSFFFSFFESVVQLIFPRRRTKKVLEAKK